MPGAGRTGMMLRVFPAAGRVTNPGTKPFSPWHPPRGTCGRGAAVRSGMRARPVANRSDEGGRHTAIAQGRSLRRIDAEAKNATRRLAQEMEIISDAGQMSQKRQGPAVLEGRPWTFATIAEGKAARDKGFFAGLLMRIVEGHRIRNSGFE